MAHRVAFHPAGRLAPDGCRSYPPAPLPLRPNVWPGPITPRRAGDVHTGRPRWHWSVRALRLDLPRLAAGRTPAAAADPGRPGPPPQYSVPAGQTARLAGVAETDAQNGDDWVVPTAPAATLLNDTVAADAAYVAAERLCPDSQRPVPSTTSGCGRPAPASTTKNLAKAARTCSAAADRPSSFP